MGVDRSRAGDRSQFIGIPALLDKHSAQVNLFQAWAHWPIRLEKCTLSMELFGHKDLGASCRAMAALLNANRKTGRNRQ